MTVVREQVWEVRNRLADFGLDEERLRDVVRRGHLAFVTCTNNHPRFIPGIWAWGETVRALREYVLPLGWRRSDENNYSVVIDPSDQMAIAVATGDEGTGQAGLLPTTKTPKGPTTVDAVTNNQFAFSFLADASDPVPVVAADADEERITWMLLFQRANNEVRCELSLPYSIGSDGKIDRWAERILLRSVPLDGDLMEVIPPTQPDVSIEVKRRA